MAPMPSRCGWDRQHSLPPTQPAPIAPVPEKAEPAADEPRSPILYYTLAAFAAILVLLLVCVPARRE